MLEKIRDENMDYLFRAILSLQTLDECYAFFDDLCTIAEIKSMSQRLSVARLLESDTHYSEIVQKTGASTATISRVNRCLHYGSDGYRMVMERIKD